MRCSRNITLAIQFLLDECLPPIIRDTHWFMWLPFKILFGNKAKFFFNFKEIAPTLDSEEFSRIYAETANVHIKRHTDINIECLKRLMVDIIGVKVLDIGCGRGYLAGLLAERGWQVTGIDIHIAEEVRSRYPKVSFRQANIENLFDLEDASFDTVICAHTLEHVQNLIAAIKELRRVAAKKLLIIVPKQRNYRYTFDLHLHFFTYPHDLLRIMAKPGIHQSCEVVGSDLYYIEEYAPSIERLATE
jgi:ubiquinone/menaquinone biosynthesis C-methylase UbiE